MTLDMLGKTPTEQTLFVRLGLAQFAALRGVDLSAALQPEYCETDSAGWQAVRDTAGARGAATRLNRLALALDLSEAEYFVLALLCAIEEDWRVGAAVRLLQAPAEDPRPALHLAQAMARDLFAADLNPLQLVLRPLVLAGAVAVHGDGPMPFRRLAVAPELAAILSGGSALWPGVTVVSPRDDLAGTFKQTATALAPQLRSGAVHHVVLRGPVETAQAAAAALAVALGRTCVRVPEPLWRGDAALRLGLFAAEAVPFIVLSVAPGDRWTPPLLSCALPVLYGMGADGGVAADAVEVLELAPPDLDSRTALWAEFVPDDLAETLAQTAALDATTIRSLGASAQLAADRDGAAVDGARVLNARRAFGAEGLARLAQPVTRPFADEALILPDALRIRFNRLMDRCRMRERAADDMGPALQGVRRLGVCALFAGPSGAGKTFAASHLADRLAMPLWRLDLSAVMNKYIGETEKNLSAALDEAEHLDVILLLDEADALFGRRGDGDGEGERYANMVTNFLLTRLERHRGITLLTTNARSRMDPAFTRRFDFIFDFPLPGPQERLDIWKAHLGPRAPDPVACQLLAAECDLPGGFIRTIALNAAAAVPGGGVIPLAVLAAAAIEEYLKLGRAVPAVLARIAHHG